MALEKLPEITEKKYSTTAVDSPFASSTSGEEYEVVTEYDVIKEKLKVLEEKIDQINHKTASMNHAITTMNVRLTNIERQLQALLRGR